MQPLHSCDTFVILPPLTKYGAVVFGKNADRPQGEVQEVVFIKGKQPQDGTVKCTYISIDESCQPTNSIILSKPAWMWGAEMGANDKNVAIGNEAVWTVLDEGDHDPSVKRLLGMDLVRLGLERGNSAEGALDVITSLLEQYGQGGPCSESDKDFCYHNSFLIADPKEAWVLETSGKLWAAEKVTAGYRNISNGLTITHKMDRISDGLLDKAELMGLCDSKSNFNFTRYFSAGGDDKRQEAGEKLLKRASRDKSFDVKDMFNVLRDKKSRICCSYDSAFPTQGSQVSHLATNGVGAHWFTATPDPSMSFFKPFVFTPYAEISLDTQSPNMPDRKHRLYKLHYKHILQPCNSALYEKISHMEEHYVTKAVNFIQNYETGHFDEVDKLMKECVEKEIGFYTSSGSM